MYLVKKKQLLQELLVAPAKEYDELLIVSGFATPAMATHHFETLASTMPIKVQLIVGMTPLVGISKSHHTNFVKFAANNPNFQCSYINAKYQPVHSKVYIWLKNSAPALAFLSSANYTLTAFRRSQDELACKCNPREAFEYFNSMVPNSIYCNTSEADDLAVDQTVLINPAGEEEMSNGQESVLLPLFSERDGKVQERSGLNWGQRDSREPNQAYIPVPSKIAQSGFFPPRGEQFSVLTDDGFPFVCVVAQDGDKAIHTTNNNSEFGEYFRNKLNVPLGSPVTIKHLDDFGNRYVKFTKINEEEYYMEYLPS